MKLDPNLMSLLPALLGQLKSSLQAEIQTRDKGNELARNTLAEIQQVEIDLASLSTSSSASAALTAEDLKKILSGLRERIRAATNNHIGTQADDLLSDLIASLPSEQPPVTDGVGDPTIVYPETEEQPKEEGNA